MSASQQQGPAAVQQLVRGWTEVTEQHYMVRLAVMCLQACCTALLRQCGIMQYGEPSQQLPQLALACLLAVSSISRPLRCNSADVASVRAATHLQVVPLVHCRWCRWCTAGGAAGALSGVMCTSHPDVMIADALQVVPLVHATEEGLTGAAAASDLQWLLPPANASSSGSNINTSTSEPAGSGSATLLVPAHVQLAFQPSVMGSSSRSLVCCTRALDGAVELHGSGGGAACGCWRLQVVPLQRWPLLPVPLRSTPAARRWCRGTGAKEDMTRCSRTLHGGPTCQTPQASSRGQLQQWYQLQ
jgi:hypothetical protein